MSKPRPIEPDATEALSHEERRLVCELFDGAETADVGRVRSAIAAGADVLHVLRTGNTVLAYAVSADSVEIATVLLEEVTKRECEASWFDSALVRAASRPPCSNGAELVRLILAAGANPSAATTHCTALQGAVYGQNTEAARALIDAGADVNGTAGSFNLVPLVIAMGMAGRMHHSDGDTTFELVEMLARAGADAGYVPKTEWASPEQGRLTPYQYAMSINRRDLVTLLTQVSGQDPCQTTVDGKPMWELIRSRVTKDRLAAREFILSLATEFGIADAVGLAGPDVARSRSVVPAL